MATVVNVNDLLDEHVTLDLECLDRIYLNAYVPNLQTSGQVVGFMRTHLGQVIPSPAVMEKWATGSARPWTPSQRTMTFRSSASRRVTATSTS